ncbi:hypothetical protein [Actinomadura latina]|uniref:Uncharacterized protein n=1 Tax=Actinomadura latina TaxID=163603 RepID=A0A846Z4N4_9ACTN|nr:hypothetical protein [Actinomadura latina]NKZ06807.1 hypothetical protein [Actinomadura latina]
MWQFALWGLAGAVANRTAAFLEANGRVKGPPWRYPKGPGGRYYVFACALHCMLATIVTSAAAASDMIPEPWVAFAMGASAPAVLAKLGRYVLLAVPADPGADDRADDRGGDFDDEGDGPDGAG